MYLSEHKQTATYPSKVHAKSSLRIALPITDALGN